MSNRINTLLRTLERNGYYRLLSKLIFLMYKIKGKNVQKVSYLKELSVWEFKLGEDFFYSSGPGWAYEYDYLKNQFQHHLGHYHLPKAGDIVVDVGAGVGEELMIFSKMVGNQGKVFAIEAHPKTFKALAYNNSQNKFSNTTLLNVAIADVPGNIFIEDSPDSLANSVSKENDKPGFTVEAITIEQLMDQFALSRIDFLKVNIEGAEQLLIKGIGNKLHAVKHMAISCHDFRYKNEGVEFFKTKQLVIDFLTKNNIAFKVRNTGNPLLDDYIYTFPS